MNAKTIKQSVKDSLWWLTAAPGIWAVHFLATYVTAAVWCAKIEEPTGSLGPVRIAVALFTVVALAGIAVVFWQGYQRQREGGRRLGEDMPHDTDTISDRRRFLGFSMILLASLSAVATLFVALVAVFVQTCE